MTASPETGLGAEPADAIVRAVMKPKPSRLALEEEGDRALNAVGIIDSHTADDLLEQLRRLGVDQDVTLNLTGVEFIDSSGLRTIITSHQDFDEAGTKLVLCGPSESVARLIDITGLRDHLHIQ